MQTAKTLTKQCQYSGWSESRLFVHASANSSLSSKLGSLPTHYVTVLFCENTDQTIIKCRCNAGSSHHLTLNLFVSSADKLYKKKITKKLVWHFIGPDLDPHCLIVLDKPSKQFRNRSNWRYTLTVLNLFDLVIATSAVMPEEYLLEYSSD